MASRGTFSQADVSRALRGAKGAGLVVQGYEVDPCTGKITVKTGSTGSIEELDEYERWKAGHEDQD